MEESSGAAVQEDWMSRVAGLARVSPAHSLAALSHAIRERQQLLANPGQWPGVCLPSGLPSCLPSGLPSCLPACLPTCLK